MATVSAALSALRSQRRRPRAGRVCGWFAEWRRPSRRRHRSLQRYRRGVRRTPGGADLLFNNAGVMLPAPIKELRTDQWEQQIDLNVAGLMHAIGAFTPQLVEAAAERGVADLINTSSIAAQNIFPNVAVYSATKAYVTHLSRHLRVELGPRGVRVAAIEPGIVGTELQSHVTDAGALQWLDGSKETMEWLTPQDIAEIVGFIAALPPRVNLQQTTIMPTGQAG
ncbi:SDR family oxidoreductase [Peterkaempfera bronchialis]|uniref:SDR family oxidoreductase n=1 Tax=Peterkaempfera bronchialis TaxID=2126346 RepID=UPI001E47DF2D|nr:SDR family oxidoreductase [Peterkaempfera bronchialis]